MPASVQRLRMRSRAISGSNLREAPMRIVRFKGSAMRIGMEDPWALTELAKAGGLCSKPALRKTGTRSRT